MKRCLVFLSDVLSHGKQLEASVFDIEAKQACNLIVNGKYPVVALIGTGSPVEKREKTTIVFLGSSEMLNCKT